CLTTTQNLAGLAHLENAVAGQDTPEICPGINDAIAPDDRAGVNHGVASDLCAIPHDCAEFLQSGRDQSIGREHENLRTIELHVGQNHTGAEVHLVAENRIADVTEMRNLRLIKNDAVLELAGIAHHDAVPDDDVLAHVA